MSSPPVARQWNSTMYMPNRVKPMRRPSMTARSCTGSHSMPVSSWTSFTRDLGRRVADVGPPGRVEPDAGVGPLHQQELPAVVADDRADGHLRRDVAGHALADRLQPLLHEVVLLAPDLEGVVGRGLDVGRHLQHLLVALLLVEALGEAQTGAGDAGQRLAPAEEVAGEVDRAGSLDGAVDEVGVDVDGLLVPCHGRHPTDRPRPAQVRGRRSPRSGLAGVEQGPLELGQVEGVGHLAPRPART